MTIFRLLDTGLLTAAENMALDEVLTRRAGAGLSPPTLRFLRFSPDAALVGYHQEAERELRLDYCAANGIEVNRRVTGGGALLFQKSSLGWEIIAPWGEGPFAGGFNAALERICLAAAQGPVFPGGGGLLQAPQRHRGGRPQDIRHRGAWSWKAGPCSRAPCW